jgi:integrase
MSQTEAMKRGPRRGRGSITKNRAGNWQVRYTDPYGKRRAGGTFRLKGDADQQLAAILASIQNGTWREIDSAVTADLNPKTITLRQASIRYRKSRPSENGRELSHYTLDEYARLVDKVLTQLADIPLRSITRDDVEAWHAGVFEKTPTQASRAYTHLNSVMLYALDRRWIRENPCRIKKASNYKPAEDPEIPSDAEVAVMLQMADQPLRTAIALAAHCGLRKGEILELRRKDITSEEDGDGDTWWIIDVRRSVRWQGENGVIVGTPKRGSVRTLSVPKVGGAEEILLERLQAIPEHPDTLIVSKDPEGKIHWSKSMLNPRWRKVAGVAGFAGRFHSLRAYHLTWFAQQGASLKELQERGGHSTHTMVMKYQRTTGRERSLLRGG